MDEEPEMQEEQVQEEEQEQEQEDEEEEEEEATTANGDEVKKEDSDIKMETASVVEASGDVSYFSESIFCEINILSGSACGCYADD